ncbi:DUF2934 domain-containing protein [Thermodesulfovibrio sp. 3907-1M]|uniref:DUF2934 domain-containing protein n=1 Tax=Thermodesulfovibrio autotrophicus TaxID=3118333 RepID=A0AAU8GYF6_9BACT
MIDREKLEEEIRQVAYELYVKSGCIPGRDLDNWLEAERIVMVKYGFTRQEKEPQTAEAEKEDKPKKRGRRVCKKGSATKKSKGRGKKS